MSSRPRKKKSEVAAAPLQTRKEAPKRPSGRAPEATVVARHGTGVVTRLGRGFSMGELSGAGLAPGLASKWGLRIDSRRRSVLEGNVDMLRRWGSHAAPAKKTEERVKRVKEELVKAEKGIEKGAAEVEKEVERAEKEVKKKATKVEKAIKARTKPKAKAKKKPKD